MRIILTLAAALALAAPAAASAQDLGQAKQFVQQVYRAYSREPGPDYLGRQARMVFAPPLLALIRRDAAMTPQGDVGALDGDPICDCQDYEIGNVEVRVTGEPGKHAVAEVQFENFGHTQLVTLDLVAVNRRWRISDVHSENAPSLASLLEDSIKSRGRPGPQ